MPSLYHWLPRGALLVKTEPAAVTTGAAGIAWTVTGMLEEVPSPQPLFPATEMFPAIGAVPKFTVMLVVPAPVAIVAPAGKVHV